MNDKKEQFVKALLLPINPAVVVLLGIYTAVWGAWVANPFWTVFTQASLYDALNTAWFVNALGTSPELFWGGMAILCGILITYGAVKRSYKSLVRGATIAFFHWGVISLYYFMGDWANTGGITAGIFAVYGAFLWLNLRVNFKDTHDMNSVLR